MLDIFDINYEHCSEGLGILNTPPDNLPKKGIFIRILSLIKGCLKYSFKKKKGGYLDKNSIFFFAISQNEKNSLKSIISELPQSSLVGDDVFKNGYPLGKIYWVSLFFIPVVFYRFLICKNTYHKRSFSYAFDGFCIAYSSKYVLNRYLIKIQPSKIIIANQLSVYHRSLLNAANKLNIETVFIQHASVNEKFSNLNLFSYALLEGEDSLLKYQKNGTRNKKLFLIGIPKFDKYFARISKSKEITSIGICTNGMDDFNKYDNLISLIKKKLPKVTLIIRPHPSDRRKQGWFELAKKLDSLYSDVTRDESFVFFQDVNLILAGDSNIHLEAALLNIPSIYYDPLDKKIDWYGFHLNKLVYYANNANNVIDIIMQLLNNLPNTRVKAKFYSESINSNFDGKSTKLATMIINEHQEKNSFLVNYDEYGNKVYRLK